MTAKEKAKNLFLKFRQIPPCSHYTGVDDGEAKQCALIAVDEILNIYQIKNAEFEFYDLRNYWQEVKTEIEKL